MPIPIFLRRTNRLLKINELPDDEKKWSTTTESRHTLSDASLPAIAPTSLPNRQLRKGSAPPFNQPDKTPVGLMNGEQLVTLLMEYNIGVRRMSHDLFELEELPIAEQENDLENKGLK